MSFSRSFERHVFCCYWIETLSRAHTIARDPRGWTVSAISSNELHSIANMVIELEERYWKHWYALREDETVHFRGSDKYFLKFNNAESSIDKKRKSHMHIHNAFIGIQCAQCLHLHTIRQVWCAEFVESWSGGLRNSSAAKPLAEDQVVAVVIRDDVARVSTVIESRLSMETNCLANMVITLEGIYCIDNSCAELRA